jgi:hypothetical protein
LTILQKVIYLCYILCTKVRILRLVKKEKKSRLIVWTFTKVPNSEFFALTIPIKRWHFQSILNLPLFLTEKKKVNKKDPLPLEKIEFFMKFLVWNYSMLPLPTLAFQAGIKF